MLTSACLFSLSPQPGTTLCLVGGSSDLVLFLRRQREWAIYFLFYFFFKSSFSFLVLFRSLWEKTWTSRRRRGERSRHRLREEIWAESQDARSQITSFLRRPTKKKRGDTSALLKKWKRGLRKKKNKTPKAKDEGEEQKKNCWTTFKCGTLILFFFYA